VAAQLTAAGIATGIHYAVPLHRSRALADQRMRRTDCPVTDAAADEILSLPIFPHMTARQVVRVTRAMREAFGLRPEGEAFVREREIDGTGAWPAA
jgi:dTDP-4-amino-4,6-dideoxygalactose transaminase